jgi:hypothetical protein
MTDGGLSPLGTCGPREHLGRSREAAHRHDVHPLLVMSPLGALGFAGASDVAPRVAVRPDRGARFRRRNEDELPSRLDPRECNGSSCRALWRYPRRDAQSDEPGRSELPEEGNSKARPAPPSFASQLLSDLAHRVLGDATRSLAAINDARAVRVGRRAPLRSARLPETVGAPALGLGSCRARERCSAPAPRLQQRADGSGSVPRRARCSSKGATLPGSENTSPARERSRLVHGRQSHQRSVR